MSSTISIYGKKTRKADMIMYYLIYVAAFLSVFLILGIITYVFVRGIGQINFMFLTTSSSFLKGTVGIAGNIVNTLIIIVITLLIATPIGVGSAIYLSEYAQPGKVVSFIEFTTETLSGIPSIIYGLFGMMFFGKIWSYSILTGALTLTIMVLPLITRNTQEALKTVPLSYRQGSLGIGATKWYMIRTVLLPNAMPGIITGVILSIGRIVGESAALLFTAGSDGRLAKSMAAFFGKIFESGGTLTIELYLRMSNGEYNVAFGIGCVLLIIVLVINMLTKVLAKKFDVSAKA